MSRKMSTVLMDGFDLENRVVLNVGGTRFETYKTVLKKIPATRLSRLTEALVNYDSITNEYFFDRHPGVFSQILNYYRTGKLHYPTNVCGPLFEEELTFWGIDSNQVEPCCWKTYTRHRTTEETLTTLDRINIDVVRTPKQELIIKFGINYLPGFHAGKIPFIKRIQPVIWQLFEEPRSSNGAMVISFIQISMIVLSVAILWISTHSVSRYRVLEMKNQLSSLDSPKQKITSFRMIDNNVNPLIIIGEYLTVAWFVIDLAIRFIVSPDKRAYLKNTNNAIDMVATLSLLIHFILEVYIDSFILQCVQVIRVFRLLRLFTYHPGLQVIITSIKMSVSILQLLIFFLVVSSTLFGALIFYAERLTTSDEDHNLFISIPDAFWYSIVSLTTIGYGDLSPQTGLGRLFGGICVIFGVLMIGLPMTIVVEVFSQLYKHLNCRSKLPKQRRRILPVEAPRARKAPAHSHHKAGPKNA